MAEDFMTTQQVPTEPTGLLPIPDSKTYNTRDGNVAQKLTYDVTGWTNNQIRELLVGLTAEQLDQQIVIGNPPAFADVDGVRGRGIASAQKRIVVSFGARLKVSALTNLKIALRQAIQGATVRRTGVLSDMGNWQYRYVRNGELQALPLSGASGIPMGPTDFIILSPEGVMNKRGEAYATAANMRVAGSGRVSYAPARSGRTTKRNQSIGFMALVARAAKASPAFDGFNVTVGFTSRYHVAGEVTRVGGVRSAYIKISPKTGRRRG